ncbi:hypothetical protein TanjilG_29390 [Lupinus angustifolius]|uniref:MOSC domain-containing protein n=1 Tax=Lupinus angustifolius TaxID=3871 RepID=A0A1J7GF12_LUPAN|nr:hypothetical protein TanjilG_29390 [Lupinus angustifolius]
MDMDAAKQEFLKEFGEHYGYPNGPKSVDQIRATEFTRLQDSQSESSSATLDILSDARQQMINNSSLCCSLTSIRYALGQGATAIAVDIEEDVHPVTSGETISMKISPHGVQRRKVVGLTEGESTGDTYNLFAFPSECNFSGLRFDLDLVNIIKENSRRISGISSVCNNGQWMVLIDAAKGCATMPPDLSKYPADFVTISFYKLFGYPTGLGALIVRKGTVAASIADIDFVKRREHIEHMFEDGTASFLSIISIRHGFKILNSLTVSAISRHTKSLTLYTRKMLLALRHDNGSRVCVLYKHHNSMELCHEMGPIVSFNLKRPDGSWYGYREVEKLASLSGIQLRKFADFVASSFLSSSNHIDHGNHLKGLKHDREWILKSLSGETITQKKVPEMCFISTLIDLSQGMLFVESPRCKKRLQIRLELDVDDGDIEDIELYGQRYKVYSYSNETNVWFSQAIGKPCTFLRYSSCDQDFLLNKTNGAAACRGAKSMLSFANEGQLLLVSKESVSDLNKRLSSDVHKGICGTATEVNASRFRPNLTVSGGRPYDEDGWRDVRIGNTHFRSLGGCNRCQMINIAQNDGQVQKSKEPLATLASYRRVQV